VTIPHLLITLLVMILFGSSYPIGKIGLNENISPLIFSLLRILPMFILLLPFLKWKTTHHKNFKYVVGYGLLMGLGLYPFMYLSLENTLSTSSMILIMQLSIPIGVVLSSVYLKERVTGRRWFFIGIVLLGLTLICFDPIVFQSRLSLIYGILAAFAYGSASMISKKLKEFSSIEVNSWMAVFSFPIMILLVFIFEEKEAANIFNHSWLAYTPALYSGIIVSCLAQILMLWLYKHYEVKTVLPFYSLFPVFGILLTIILLNESISFLIITGSMIVILGNYFLQKEK
tara:strand:- start:1067 stop:1924 length:858 start_codon:yes stop_codon:yes gene_type:complete